tara:strand:+ start:271 stop:522 length:252 start_codon:yes stop_codon:yes gene_type:complete
MKNRLSKSINRLKKENKVSKEPDNDSRALSALNVKIFRNLAEKYDLSLTINENSKDSEKQETSLTLGAQITLERLKKGEDFKP